MGRWVAASKRMMNLVFENRKLDLDRHVYMFVEIKRRQSSANSDFYAGCGQSVKLETLICQSVW